MAAIVVTLVIDRVDTVLIGNFLKAEPITDIIRIRRLYSVVGKKRARNERN